MANPFDSGNGAQSLLIKLALGFFGVIAAAKLLPRTVVYMIRRYVLNLVTEMVVVVIAALLTEKIARQVTGQSDDLDEEFPSVKTSHE